MKTVDILLGGDKRVSVPEARSFFQRLVGLMFSAPGSYPTGLYFAKCNCIHTCFMRYDLDVFFLDKDGRICREVRGLKPWRACHGGPDAVAVFETRSGLYPAVKQGHKLNNPQQILIAMLIVFLGLQ